MQFRFHMPTKAYFGAGCIAQYSKELAVFGRKAIIITGGRSAQQSGALANLLRELDQNGIEYTVFDKVENNPSTDIVKAGGIEAAKTGAQFVVGIGGGSPMDAAKAIAVLAVNEIEPIELFTNNFKNKPLPIICIPTTSGTGSEVTPYSILTRSDLETKISFGNEDTFPKIAFLDPHYTESQPWEVTVNTAIDAFSHCMEGYLGRKRTPTTDALAQEGIKIFGKSLKSLRSGNVNYEDRENLMYVSMLGGMVISHTGTTIIHGAGYNLTYFKGIPHGRANGYLMEEYLKFNYEFAKDRIDNVINLLQLKSIEEFGKAVTEMIGKAPVLNEYEIEKYAGITMKQRSTASNIRPVTASDIAVLYRNMT